MKHASVYCKKDGWYVRADSQTTIGVYIASAPYLKLAIDASPEDLGKAVQSALEGSQAGVPHPTEWDHIIRPMYELAKVKTWGRFAKDACYVSVEFDGDRFTIKPWSKDQHMNFGSMSNDGVQLPRDASAAEIGDAVKRVVALCT
jgi:hypothetical protein